MLTDFCEQYKDNPVMKKYGGDLKIFKNQQGQYVIFRKPVGQDNYVEATNDQLKLIAGELSKSLDREYANALGVPVPKNATAQQLTELTQNTFNRYKSAYETSFKKAFGKKDIKILSENL